MNRKEAIHSLLKIMAFELLEFIREAEQSVRNRWVPAADIRNTLELNLVAVPVENVQYGEKGWLFAILARMLEDEGLVEYKKEDNRSYYRTKKG